MNTLPVFYDLISTHGHALSPWCWHVRMALAHKGIAFDHRPHRFTDKDALIAAGGKTFPLLVDTDGATHTDSLDIVLHLEATRPTPPLFPDNGGGGGIAAYRFMHRYIQTILFPNLAKVVLVHIPDILDGADRDYFIESREGRFGKTLAEVCADPEATLKVADLHLDPFRRAMADGGYIAGAAPAMADYLLFGVMQWARIAYPGRITAPDDTISTWMEGMLDLFDGLGRSVPARG